MVEKKATRVGYAEGLIKLGEEDPNVVVIDADTACSTKSSMFRDRFPERFINVGVAEQDLIGTAAGLALCGKNVFATAYSAFVSNRAMDQIRNTVCYSNLNVKIGASHSGIITGADGATHQSTEEIATMRVLPNMKVVIPCDAIEAKKATIQAGKMKGPIYIRLGREAVSVISHEDTPFIFGKANILKDGEDVAIIACGFMVHQVLSASEKLAEKGIYPKIINMHTVKPIDDEIIKDAAQKMGAIVTCEEHQLNGGLGSGVAEIVVKTTPIPIEMVGIRDKFGESGCPKDLLELFNLTPDEIVNATERVLRRKVKSDKRSKIQIK